MADRENRNEDDWAAQVPDWHHDGPYEDYGWEQGESGLPYFRDPSTHLEHRERERVRRWHRRHPEAPMDRDFRGNQAWDQPGPYTGLGPRGYRRTDERILEDVNERMTQHGHLDASRIDIEVNNAEVTLKGAVDSRRSKHLAEDIAESVAGVQDVHNQLHIDRYPSGGQGRIDRVGRSGVYPASSHEAPEDSEVRGMAEWGQGERGAAGYQDHGESELHIGRERGQEQENE